MYKAEERSEATRGIGFSWKSGLTMTLLLGWMPGAMAAGNWPEKPVRIVVPYAVGGGSDILARQIAAGLQSVWGQPIVVDNKPGASGNIGTMEVVRSPADGHTLLLQNSTMVINQAVTAKKNYEPLDDLTPIMLVGATPLALAATPASNVKNIDDILKAGASSASHYGSCGVGTPQHFVMELLKQRTGFKSEHVGYKGCAPALTDLLGGQIPYAVLTANMIVPYTRSGRLQAIGVSTAGRYAQLPDTPTFEEQGVKPFDFTVWYALMGPADVPPEVAARIRQDVDGVLADPQIRAKLAEVGIEENSGGAERLAEIIKADQVRYAQIAESAGIRPD